LRRYSCETEAACIAAGIPDAADFFAGRLLEAFGGYDRTVDEVSGQVPHRMQRPGLVHGLEKV